MIKKKVRTASLGPGSAFGSSTAARVITPTSIIPSNSGMLSVGLNINPSS